MSFSSQDSLYWSAFTNLIPVARLTCSWSIAFTHPGKKSPLHLMFKGILGEHATAESCPSPSQCITRERGQDTSPEQGHLIVSWSFISSTRSKQINCSCNDRYFAQSYKGLDFIPKGFRDSASQPAYLPLMLMLTAIFSLSIYSKQKLRMQRLFSSKPLSPWTGLWCLWWWIAPCWHANLLNVTKETGSLLIPYTSQSICWRQSSIPGICMLSLTSGNAM